MINDINIKNSITSGFQPSLHYVTRRISTKNWFTGIIKVVKENLKFKILQFIYEREKVFLTLTTILKMYMTCVIFSCEAERNLYVININLGKMELNL